MSPRNMHQSTQVWLTSHLTIFPHKHLLFPVNTYFQQASSLLLTTKHVLVARNLNIFKSRSLCGIKISLISQHWMIELKKTLALHYLMICIEAIWPKWSSMMSSEPLWRVHLLKMMVTILLHILILTNLNTGAHCIQDTLVLQYIILCTFLNLDSASIILYFPFIVLASSTIYSPSNKSPVPNCVKICCSDSQSWFWPTFITLWPVSTITGQE